MGYGLEMPCVYRIYGTKAYVDKMNEGNNRLHDVLWTSLDQYLCSYILSNVQIMILLLIIMSLVPRPHPRGRVTGREKGCGLLAVRYLEVKLY